MAPTAISSQYKNDSASFSYSQKGDGSVRIRHREYVRDISATGATYAVQSIPINPGINDLFVWLSAIALSYESYIFNSLSFEFESSAVTTDRGTVMMGIDFDAADPPPTTKQQFMSVHGSTRSSVWTHQCCSASSQDLRKFGVQRYVRNAAPIGTQDIKTYDVGNFHIATQGTANVTCGELYVTYDITLHTPQPSGLNQLYGYNCKFTSNIGITSAKPLGDAFLTFDGGLVVRWRTSTSFYIDTIGQYLVNLLYTGSGFESTDANTLSVSGGGSALSLYGAWQVTSSGGETSAVYRVDITQPGAFISVSMSGNSPTFYAYRISPYLSVLD